MANKKEDTDKNVKPKRKLTELEKIIKAAKLDPRNPFHNDAKREFLRINSDKRDGIFKYADTSDKSMFNHGKSGSFIDGLFSFGLKTNDVLSSDFSAGKAIANLGVSINPINASSKTDIMNSLGLLTKSQKYHEKVNRVNSLRGMTSGMNLMFANDSLKEGVDPISGGLQFGLNSAIMFGGLRVGEAAGGLASTLVKGKTAKKMMLNTGRFAGFAGGVGIVAFSGLGDSISTMASSTNEFAKSVNDMFHNSQYASEFQSQETLTARQAALSKLSKAGINDRALILGNEALMYRSVM